MLIYLSINVVTLGTYQYFIERRILFALIAKLGINTANVLRTDKR